MPQITRTPPTVEIILRYLSDIRLGCAQIMLILLPLSARGLLDLDKLSCFCDPISFRYGHPGGKSSLAVKIANIQLQRTRINTG